MIKNFTPIKLMERGSAKKALLKVKGESDKIDRKDLLEKQIGARKNRRARALMAIEDASEVAKWYFQQKDFYEKISRGLQKETGVKFSFLQRSTGKMSKAHKDACDLKFVLVEESFLDGTGHYGMIISDKKGVQVYDSMGEGTFIGPASKMFKNQKSKKSYVVTPLRDKGGMIITVQPSGGFVAKSTKEDHFKFWNDKPEQRGRIFQLHQLDELSQHHFCYVESFVAMFKRLGLTKGGPADPRDRLPWIKRVMWAIILKNTPKKERKGPEWEYFRENFKYYLKTRNENGKKLELDHEASMQMPPKKGNFKVTVGELKLDETIDSSWSYKKIMKWV